jgi:hypothetical protein
MVSMADWRLKCKSQRGSTSEPQRRIVQNGSILEPEKKKIHIPGKK